MALGSPNSADQRSPDCPGDEELRLLLRDVAEPVVTEGLAAHLETCGPCRRKLDLLAGVELVVPASLLPVSGVRESTALRAVMERVASREFAGGAAGATSEPASNWEILLPPERPGTLGRFAGYDVLERIASGGMGIVFKALDPVLNRVVAIKVLAPVLAANERARARFLREARAAAAVSHEHVVAIHAVGEDRGLPFLVMQFIAGTSLEARLQKGPLELEKILRIGRQTALGLAAAHAQGLIHRDIKPGNILLENGVERVKLTDFGLARATDSPSVTRAGMIAGTPEFMSPEQARGESVDARSDLFSLGSVLYMMSTGRSPFVADSIPATLKRVCDVEPPSVQEINRGMPAWLVELIGRLMAKDPNHRLADANQLAQLLEEGLSRVQLASSGTPAPPNKSGLSHRWYAAGALVLGAMVAGIWWWKSNRALGLNATSADGPPGLFRLLKEGVAPREFAGLAEAVVHWETGASIEVRFDGPQLVDPVDIASQDLVLRAAPGMRPVLVNRASGVSFLRTTGSLTVEGLEFRALNADCDSTALANPDPAAHQLVADKLRDRPSGGEGSPALIHVRGGNLIARNCRFVTSLREPRTTDGILVAGGRKIELSGCEFYTLDGLAVRWRSLGNRVPSLREAASVISLTNNLFLAARPLGFAGASGDCDLTLDHNTFVSMILFTLGPRAAPTVSATRNVFVLRGLYDARPRMGVLQANRWLERQNIFCDPIGSGVLGDTVAIVPGATSRTAKLGFRERWAPLANPARRMTPLDFQITAEDAAATPGMTRVEMREYGIRPAAVGPGLRPVASGP